MSLPSPSTRPMASLTAAFAAWKALLLAVALGAAGAPEFDTSTSLTLDVLYGRDTSASTCTITNCLTRWDAIYFVSSARRGYFYEQEWAFAAGLPTVVRAVGAVLRAVGVELAGWAWEPLVAVFIAHVSHLIAVLALDRKLAYLAAVLHVLSPAGLFLSAPHAESPFSCLSNGLFSGLLFAVETVRCLLAYLDGPSLTKVLHLLAPVIGGLLVAMGILIPQAVAWMRYCSVDSPGAELRPWCSRLIPSIYTFVQEEYC
ncbi:ER membrane glycoprotein subunit of the GPI transamidase complex-like protein [Neonectria magnoliae]|uniref:GPI mannosyltransferase 2 n=1 Tax=Neonectria magnoliae TaxID=2732573 RepID=A0ABR1H1X8_9HYPO